MFGITIKRARLLHDSYTGKDAEFSNQTAKLIAHTLSAPTDDVEWSLAIPHPEILEFLRDEFAIESIVCTPTLIPSGNDIEPKNQKSPTHLFPGAPIIPTNREPSSYRGYWKKMEIRTVKIDEPMKLLTKREHEVESNKRIAIGIHKDGHKWLKWAVSTLNYRAMKHQNGILLVEDETDKEETKSRDFLIKINITNK